MADIPKEISLQVFAHMLGVGGNPTVVNAFLYDNKTIAIDYIKNGQSIRAFRDYVQPRGKRAKIKDAADIKDKCDRCEHFFERDLIKLKVSVNGQSVFLCPTCRAKDGLMESCDSCKTLYPTSQLRYNSSTSSWWCQECLKKKTQKIILNIDRADDLTRPQARINEILGFRQGFVRQESERQKLLADKFKKSDTIEIESKKEEKKKEITSTLVKSEPNQKQILEIN